MIFVCLGDTDCSLLLLVPLALLCSGTAALGTAFGMGSFDALPHALAINYAASAVGIVVILLAAVSDMGGVSDSSEVMEVFARRVFGMMIAAMCCLGLPFLVSFAIARAHDEEDLLAGSSHIGGEAMSWWSAIEVTLVGVLVVGLCSCCISWVALDRPATRGEGA